MDNSLVEDASLIDVKYIIEFNDSSEKSFDTHIDLTSDKIHHYSDQTYPWTELDFHKCEHCPLSSKEVRHCPAALSLTDIVEFFSSHQNYQDAKCMVVLPEKNIHVEKPLSEILSCLIGLRFATSKCPYLSKLKMMARFHEPFSTPLYTFYRATSMHLLQQYLKKSRNEEPDWSFDSLKILYEKLSIINLRISDRLKSISGKECAPCSMSILSVLTVTMTLLFDEHLKILDELDRS